jgi:hypothetical protein
LHAIVVDILLVGKLLSTLRFELTGSFRHNEMNAFKTLLMKQAREEPASLVSSDRGATIEIEVIRICATERDAFYLCVGSMYIECSSFYRLESMKRHTMCTSLAIMLVL